MAKEKRKPRLEKGAGGSGGTEFIGFGAFASSGPVTSSSFSALKPSPVYTGPDAQVALTFRRIGQKRDGSTKARALDELFGYFSDESLVKKEQALALAHLAFLFQSKLHYDDSSSVRTSSIRCLHSASLRLPKAWNSIVSQEKSGILGMLWCAQEDPSSEVQSVSRDMCNSIDSKRFINSVMSYVGQILGYKRPINMHEALFARKSDAEQMSDLDRDQMDERFERIVGTALSGLELCIRRNPESDSFLYEPIIKDMKLWEMLASSRSALRRASYSLVSAMCQFAKSGVYGDFGLPLGVDLLAKVVGLERDGVNIPSLIEMILLYLTSIKSDINMEVLVKQLSKSLKRACFGAGARSWAPLILPLIGSTHIESEDHILSLLSSLWIGKSAALGAQNVLAITVATTECSSYLLLREEPETSLPFATSVADIWLETFAVFLTLAGMTSVGGVELEDLADVLGKSMNKLDLASTESSLLPIASLEWFWQTSFSRIVLEANGSTSDKHLCRILEIVQAHRERPGAVGTASGFDPTNLHGPIRKKFLLSLSSVTRVPSEEECRLMLECVQFCGIVNVFVPREEDSFFSQLHDFLTNHLFKWMVVHSSLQSSDHEPSMARVEFSIFGCCLVSLPQSQRSLLWEACLSEFTNNDCDLSALADGISMLVRRNEKGFDLTETVRSARLDEMCLGVAQTSVENVFEPTATTDVLRSDGMIRKFLSRCLGMGSDSKRLVSYSVISSMVDAISAQNEVLCTERALKRDSHPVLVALLELVKVGVVQNDDDVGPIILHSWLFGGTPWTEQACLILSEKPKHTSKIRFQIEARANLSQRLATLCTSDFKDNLEATDQIVLWSKHAFRILQSDMNAHGADAPSSALFKSVLVGENNLVNVVAGNPRSSEVLFWSLHVLVSSFDSYEDRCRLIQDKNSWEVIGDILPAISRASSDLTAASDSRCTRFLDLFGGYNFLTQNIIERWVRSCVEMLANQVGNPWIEKIDCDRLSRGISTLSNLVGMRFKRRQDHNDFIKSRQIDRDSIKEGDTLWYAKQESGREVLERVRILTIHRDDYPNVYFTIKSADTDNGCERQTELDRLRLSGTSTRLVSDDGAEALSSEEHAARQRMGTLIMERLIKPFFEPTQGDVFVFPGLDVLAECINIVVGQCGLVGRPGIGSTQFNILQIVTRLQRLMLSSLADDTPQCTRLLRSLSSAMGIGRLTPPSQNFGTLRFDASESIEALLHSSVGQTDDTQFNLALLEWLTVSITGVSKEETRANAFGSFYTVASKMLLSSPDTTPSACVSLLMMRFYAACPTLPPSPSSAEEAMMSRIIDTFATMLSNEEKPLFLDQKPQFSRPSWFDCFSLFVNRASTARQTFMSQVCRAHADSLAASLFVEPKRWLSFRLLCMGALGEYTTQEAHAAVALHEDTKRRLSEWKHGLLEEEASELEDDLMTVSQWLPKGFMIEIESWSEDDAVDKRLDNKEVQMSRMLAWLCVLEFFEAASRTPKNRGAFSSYIQSCSAAKCILNSALYFLPVESIKGLKKFLPISMNDVNEKEARTEMSELSGLVFSRTVDVLPTLSKNWWEEDCPKSIVPVVSQFIEGKIAPQILRRELQRIQTATNLGEMVVSASAVSREVVATYVLDECQLSIAIHVPKNFPLRNVEVDGRKTLGIPEKRWKRWALQIRLMLNSQDSSLLDALMLWKDNIDREFEGVEPCPICYSVLSVKSHELPNLQCKHCRNRFHSSCLYKWFNSSGKSQCVLCQQPWSGTRVA